MIAVIVDHVLREFEQRTTSPTRVRQIARIFQTWLDRGDGVAVIRDIQVRRLRRAIAYTYERSPFYREMFNRLGLRPSDIRQPEDLWELPFTTSQETRDWRRFLSVPEDQLSAVFTSSGTTGEPKRVYYSRCDMQTLTNLAAIALRVGHPGRMTVLIALPMSHGLWMGSAIAQRVVERAGGLPIPVGADNPVETIRWMQRFDPNVVMSSPSYFTALTREAEEQGYHLKLDKVLLGGETLTTSQKEYFSMYWGAHIFDSYGSTEIGGAQTIALPQCTAFNMNDLHLVTEIINPETGSPTDEGELVFTTLAREAMPFLRYRSGDRGRWANCSCGMPFRAIQLLGRTDDMIVAGDMNLYGHILAEAVASVPGTSGRVALRLDKVELIDRLLVRVEGLNVDGDAVRNVLSATYPELRVNTVNGNLILEIETDVDLGSQIKAVKIVDERKA